MKIYLVLGWTDNGIDEESEPWIYGVYSDKDKANEIKNNILKSICEHEEDHEKVKIFEVILDQPTEQYEFMITT